MPSNKLPATLSTNPGVAAANDIEDGEALDETLSQSEKIAKRVRALMTSKGIRKSKHRNALMDILNLSSSQCHKKLIAASSDWSQAQVVRVAEHFGVLPSTIDTTFSLQTIPADDDAVSAIFVIEGRELPCMVCTGEALSGKANVSYVAYREDGNWFVVETAKAPDNAIRHEVKKLDLQLEQARKRSVAILDDDEGSADSLRDYLIDLGFHAEAFYRPDDLEEKLGKNLFDAFVIDWFLGTKTAESLIKSIRIEKGPPAPIFLLTGQIATDREKESEVARMISEYTVVLQEKPMKLSIISANISKALDV